MGEVEYKFENKRKSDKEDHIDKAIFTASLNGKPIVRVTLDSYNGELGVYELVTDPKYRRSTYKYAIFKKILANIDEIDKEFGTEHKKIVNEMYDQDELPAYETFGVMRENKTLLRLISVPSGNKK